MQGTKLIKFTKTVGPIDGLIKSPAIWGENDKGESTPVVYFRKPKWLPQEKFDRLMSELSISLPCDFCIEVNNENK